MTIAFYAPLKSPNHPTPSGDRRMGQLLISALKKAGHQVNLASEFRSFNKTGADDVWGQIKTEAALEIDRLKADYENNGPPELWFTYHLYHKAPDLIGPKIARHFNIPYCLAEASYAPKQKGGAWDLGLKASEEALNLAGRVYTLNPDDLACIRPHLPGWCEMIALPPFLDIAPYQAQAKPEDRAIWAKKLAIPEDDIWTVTVAMMREGDKFQSYELLAKTWETLGKKAAPLIVIGDGPKREEVEALFKNTQHPVHFTGKMEAEDIASLLQHCELFVWPGIKEAFGLAMMEAQAAGVSVISANRAGIASFIHHGKTGLLAPEGDVDALVAATERLLDDADLRDTFSLNAEHNMALNHSIKAAAQIFKQSLPL